jgi:hypothetical protein
VSAGWRDCCAHRSSYSSLRFEMVQVDVCDGSRLREFLTTEEFKESVRAQFEELDTDHTGGLSKAQLKVGGMELQSRIPQRVTS